MAVLQIKCVNCIYITLALITCKAARW